MSTTLITSTATKGKCSITQDLKLLSNASEHHHNFEEFYTKYEQNLKDVGNLLMSKVGKDSFEGLIMIDSLQRLGIHRHFQKEINAVLENQYLSMSNDYFLKFNLFEVSLCFRLLRQKGFYVPADVFDQFKGEDGKFKEILRGDINGLKGLYEASQLSILGEKILQEAETFSSKLLHERMAFLDQHEARTVKYTLEHPYHKSLAKFMAENYTKDFNDAGGWKNVSAELAKSDFNMVRAIHQKELIQVSRWWKDLGLAMELKLARSQPLKWYLGPMASLTDPRMSEQRIELTKSISLIYIIDDIFDVYGTVDELTLLTEAVNRWDLAAMEQLPGYMKACFKALYDLTNEIGHKAFEKHGSTPVVSLRKSWASLCNAFLVEAKWFASGILPNAEEYLKNGTVSSGMHVVIVHMFFLLEECTNMEIANLVNDISGIVSSIATILRLWDDLGSAEDENQEGNDGSYITCYMNENPGATPEIARQHVTKMISEAWKCLNKELLSPNSFSENFIEASLNLARMVPLMYGYDDNHRLPILEKHIASMLYEGIPLEGSLY